MKKLLALLVLGILVLSGFGAVALPSDKIKTDFQWKQEEFDNISLNDDEIDQFQIESTYSWPVGPCPQWLPPNVNNSIAQSFIPTMNILTRVQIYIGKNRTATYPYVLAIREELTGDDIAIISVDAEHIATESFNWTEFDFDDFLLTPYQTYYLVSYTSNVTDNWYAWSFDLPNFYPNGNMAFSIDDGETWESNDTFDTCFITYGKNNQPPDEPTITGQKDGKIGKEYEYTFKTTDSDGDDIRYYIDWGDSNQEWTDYYTQDTEVKIKKTYDVEDTYSITVYAQDIYGADGNSVTYEVTMPKYKGIYFDLPIIDWLFERFPNVFYVLRYMVGL